MFPPNLCERSRESIVVRSVIVCNIEARVRKGYGAEYDRVGKLTMRDAIGNSGPEGTELRQIHVVVLRSKRGPRAQIGEPHVSNRSGVQRIHIPDDHLLVRYQPVDKTRRPTLGRAEHELSGMRIYVPVRVTAKNA